MSTQGLSDPCSPPAGYLIIHVLQSLCGLGLMYSLVLPVAHGQGLQVLRGLGIGT